MTDKPARIGRPPEPVPQDIAEEVLLWSYAGGSLVGFCKQPGKPGVRTVYDWMDKDPEFAAEYARAKLEGSHSLFDEAGEIADAATPETVQVAKLRADHRYRACRARNPGIYGDKAQVEHQGGVSLRVVTGVPKPEALEP